MNTERAIVMYAKGATLAKNDVLYAKTDWEENQHLAKLKAYRNNLEILLKQTTNQGLIKTIKKIVKYLDASKLEGPCLMYQANQLLLQISKM